ncbi:hypothetical protein ACG83_41385 [Frankia sp. R43]|uniref:hypothetical protein n=1 Tax=Frankia sp. R43 TaxID=269536 RepID=UPI0006C9FE7B|nr:hypothetical protein [Frankia sp. R43]KPM50233.1 hypothetical protein ACG83_41385 [Frankia sp. R43]
MSRQTDRDAETLRVLTTEKKLKEARISGTDAEARRLERRIDDSLNALGYGDKYKGSQYGH